MAEKHLIKAISRRFKKMPAAKRVAKIRKLAGKSAADEKFIRQVFPDLYQEAQQRPSSWAGGRSESEQRVALHAKPS